MSFPLFGAVLQCKKGAELTAAANNKFSLALYHTLDNADNLVASPFSLHAALALTYVGARGTTAQQIAKGLHLPQDKGTVKAGYRQTLGVLRGSTLLEVATRLYLQTGAPVLKEFRKAARKAFLADTKELDFARNTEKARRIINNWVQKRTHSKISNMIAPGILNPLTRLVLINAVYFKAQWLQPFNSDDTKTEPFHVNSTDQVEVPMMHIKSYFNFKNAEDLGAKILELPYEGETASMFILLPNELDGLASLESSLSARDMNSILQDMQAEELNVSLPRFKVESSLDLQSTLENLGMKDMFNIEAADFSGITGSKDIYVSHVLQKAFIEVTELGTEAGASSAVVAEARSWRPPPLEYVADHPFVFLIWEKRLNTTLFMGRFSGPQ
ncbi:hypothetical protein ANN_07843 [Periplaneta americana]|uniref:Serpin domain-containing protein n=1 Tax=Periplaneta americana TaxID=6978 RepID=A0ABQ8T1A8_PERAM|nr:hypothetical protein ANN_07843 [Periplaneta americana]